MCIWDDNINREMDIYIVYKVGCILDENGNK